MVCRVIPAGRVRIEKGRWFLKKMSVHRGKSQTRHIRIILPGKRSVGTLAYQPVSASLGSEMWKWKAKVS
jgi:hypothetical protein